MYEGKYKCEARYIRAGQLDSGICKGKPKGVSFSRVQDPGFQDYCLGPLEGYDFDFSPFHFRKPLPSRIVPGPWMFFRRIW